MTKIIITLIVLFVIGAILDILSTKYTLYITERKIKMAILFSMIITACNIGVLSYIITAAESSVPNIVSFVAGGGLGTGACLFYSKK